MLDNPVWNALATRHAHFALGAGRVKRYPADVAPFLATAGADAVDRDESADLATPGEALYLMEVNPSPPAGWEVERRSALLQMVHERRVGATPIGDDYSVLGTGDVPDMLELTALAFPGYFRSRTIEMGAYFGVRRDGRLVAMAGQRMFLDGYREVSGVCTHPDHRGRGHASRLITLVVDEILRDGLTPFLHVAGDNAGARTAYEKLGFVVRRELSLLRVRRL
ncbi:MAG: GNAT family N-acetyltransferase [Paludisphaera borealis]|uniref:GNAT family N-acetyltransferase n=1 Tax=Paludisphaera borealis TaxID=1387353 RepID=UPI0028511B65|nr:GNAT family N-acetyltransferase [Paludisphaera borealis]MDR3620574.1 GNAT family N-acetyltransferase [Paludisphaera borealis]